MKLYPIIFEMALTSNSEAKRFGDLIRQEMDQYKGLELRIQILRLRTFLGENGFIRLGSEGTGRVVYGISGTDFVIKVAKNLNGLIGGVAQNRTEVKLKSECLTDKYFTKIYDYDEEQYLWIIAEKVQAGLSEEQLLDLLVKSLEGSDPEFLDNIRNSPDPFFKISDVLSGGTDVVLNSWGQGLSDELNKCSTNADDFHEENWGLRNDGSLVVLDYGF